MCNRPEAWTSGPSWATSSGRCSCSPPACGHLTSGQPGQWTVPTSNWSLVILCFCFVVTFTDPHNRTGTSGTFLLLLGDFLLCHVPATSALCLWSPSFTPLPMFSFCFTPPPGTTPSLPAAFCFISTVSYATEAIWILRWPQTGDFTGYSSCHSSS